VIVYGSTEIDGYVFCSGLTPLKLSYEASPKLQSLIPSITYLIRDAIFRPKYVSSPGRVSLGICSLGELIDTYHAREATHSRDKVFALLNMSSDEDIPPGLLPDHNVQWDKLFGRLVKFLLPGDVSVETCEHCQRAVINSKGCILGRVSSVTSGDGQSVKIISKNAAWHSSGEREWSLQASAKSIREGDIVCLLQGALKPTIIRLCKDHFAVVVISVTPLNESGSSGRPEPSKPITHFPRDFLLVWDWENPLEDLQDQEEYETWTKNSQLQEHSKAELGDHLDKVTRIWNTALILGDLEEYGRAEERLREAIEGYAMANGDEHLHALKSQYGLTPLSLVAGNGYDEAVRLLLAKDSIDPDLKDSQHGRTPLSWAVEGGHEAIVKLLLKTGKVEVNSKDKKGRTPLLWAAEGGHEAIVKLLLKTGKVEVDSKDKKGRTPLLWAAEGGHEAIVKLLLKTGKVKVNFKDNSGWRPLLQAAKRGYLAIVEQLLQEKAEVNAGAAEGSRRTALQAAAEGGHLAVVERLLQERAEVNAKAAESYGRTALQAAAGGGHLAVVERLLQEKAEVNAVAAERFGRTALQAAAGRGHLAIVERLLQEKAEVNAVAAEVFGRTALQAAAGGGHLAIVERLLQEKAEVNAKVAGIGGRTALQAAAERGHPAIVKCLRDAGAV
jgi:ankyrin repeat protein